MNNWLDKYDEGIIPSAQGGKSVIFAEYPTLENALFSTREHEVINPVRGRDYDVYRPTYQHGGIASAQDGLSAKLAPIKQKVREKLYRTIPPSDYPIRQLPSVVKNLITGRERMNSLDEINQLLEEREQLSPIIKQYEKDFTRAWNSSYGEERHEATSKVADKYGRELDELSRIEMRLDKISGGYDVVDEDLWRKYLEMPQLQGSVRPSRYKPTKAKDPSAEYFTIPDIVEDGTRNWKADVFKFAVEHDKGKGEFPTYDVPGPPGLARIKVDKGKDKKGEYYSIYDIYDFNIPGERLIGKPFEIYDRIYVDKDKKGNYTPRYQRGGITSKFLEPNSPKLPIGHRPPLSAPSSERAMSIGGEGGEPAYHIPNSVKGNIIPLSREDYLRQQYQNYLKSQAEKGRKAVTDATDKFAKDYVIPAIKTAGSFTLAGPLIGLMDAKQAWDDGNRGWALAGAAAEALPYIGKGVGKGVKPLVNFADDFIGQHTAVRNRADRLLSQQDKWVGQDNKELLHNLENANWQHSTSGDYAGKKLGVRRGNATMISKEANLTNANKARIAAHEVGHYYNNSPMEADEWNSFFDFSNLNNRIRTYLKGKPVYKGSSEFGKGKGLVIDKGTLLSRGNANEIRERAAQLKDYIAKKNGIPLNKDFIITESQLDDAIQNYVKNTGLDNNMSQMLGSLVDKRGFLNAMNKYALGVAPITAIGTGAIKEKFQKGGTIFSSREIPEITVYGKKNYLQELDKQQQKYLADMAKFKQDSTQWVKANQAYQDSLALYKDTEGIRYNSDKFKGHTFISAEEAEKAKKEDRFMFYDLNPHLDPAYEYDSGELGELRDKIKPIGYIGADIRKDPIYGPAGARFYASLPIYKKPTIPTPPAKPTGTNVEYDPTYENLQMRPLWATMAKQDTTSKIGTLNPLDPLYEKGFTYGEAQKFPEEIRRQYKLDYPIYQNGGEITREDYLRQQYEDYLKQQAQIGASVTELPIAKKGGKYQKGGEIDPVLNEVKDAYNFIKSYHYSPKFEERYRNMYANDLLYNTKHEDHFIDYYSNIIPTIQNPQLKKEYEDQLRYYQKERDESLKKLDEKVDLSVSTARNKLKDLSFFTLRGEKRQPWSDRIIRSFKGRPNPEGVETGSHYNTANNIAFIYKDQAKDKSGNPGSIAAHEFSHAVSSHVPYSIDMILKQSKMLTNPRDEHDIAFDETKSDIDALRYLLNKNKIYDTRTQDFTKEHLQRAKKTIKDFSFDRLQRLYNDDDLIELMNIIAANDNDKKEPVTIAKKGGVVKSNQLRTFTEDNGWLDKYQEGGEVFLQPNSKKLPRGYKVPLKNESSELAMSIGGEQGEPAYLIPSFKYGRPLLNPIQEFQNTGEHLGGPFKTWQEADKWEREIRHPYVEKGQPIPTPLRRWGKEFKEGGAVSKIANITKYDEHIWRAAKETGADPYVLKAIMMQESSFRPRKNKLGYEGFSQTNQETIDTVNRNMGTSYTIEDQYDPYMAAKFIAHNLELMKKKGWATSLDEQLIGYNWGPGNVKKYRKTKELPKETANYVAKINEMISEWKPKIETSESPALYPAVRDATNVSRTLPIYDIPDDAGIVQDNAGYLNPSNYGSPVRIGSNDITMRGVPFPVLGVSDEGEVRIMMPGEDHRFRGSSVTEFPLAQDGAIIRSDDRNFFQRLNDRISSEYYEHRPALFDIFDPLAPAVDYLTGHGDPNMSLGMAFPGKPILNTVPKLKLLQRPPELTKILDEVYGVRRPPKRVRPPKKTYKYDDPDFKKTFTTSPGKKIKTTWKLEGTEPKPVTTETKIVLSDAEIEKIRRGAANMKMRNLQGGGNVQQLDDFSNFGKNWLDKYE